MAPPHTPCRHTSAVVLAGGRAARMGGEDKCLLPLAGRPLVAWLIDALRPQVEDMLISANRNLERYAAFGPPLVQDRLDDFQGPLAGIMAALERCRGDCLLSAPGDAPLLAPDYAARMRAALAASGARACVAEFQGRRQPVYCLLSKELGTHLQQWLDAGGRAVHDWLAAVDAVGVDFSDRPQQFLNLNRPDDLARLEAQVSA